VLWYILDRGRKRIITEAGATNPPVALLREGGTAHVKEAAAPALSVISFNYATSKIEIAHTIPMGHSMWPPGCVQHGQQNCTATFGDTALSCRRADRIGCYEIFRHPPHESGVMCHSERFPFGLACTTRRTDASAQINETLHKDCTDAFENYSGANVYKNQLPALQVGRVICAITHAHVVESRAVRQELRRSDLFLHTNGFSMRCPLRELWHNM